MLFKIKTQKFKRSGPTLPCIFPCVLSLQSVQQNISGSMLLQVHLLQVLFFFAGSLLLGHFVEVYHVAFQLYRPLSIQIQIRIIFIWLQYLYLYITRPLLWILIHFFTLFLPLFASFFFHVITRPMERVCNSVEHDLLLDDQLLLPTKYCASAMRMQR